MSVYGDSETTDPLSISPTQLYGEPRQEESVDPLADEDFDKVPYLIGCELPEDGHIKDVLGYFTQNTYDASEVDPRVQIALDTCLEYLEKDYTVTKIDNREGIFSSYYPAIIPFIDGERNSPNTITGAPMSANELYELIRLSYRARCRQRFPVSVIMYRGKSICRSATLAGSAEIYGRMTLDVFRPGNVPQGDDASVNEMISAQLVEDETGWKTINQLQLADIALLKQLKVATIVDLMVENKKSKLGVPVTSSEKVDKENKYHSNFNLLSLPFPGCEFFKEFHDNNYIAHGLCFNWHQSMCDAELSVPAYPALDDLNINWADYKNWDLIEMTQNYIKYILHYFQDNTSGILIHCISGWDRTPLFISLLRMSLWADGVIHKSLNFQQMLYFTLAYDWMLFGHHLTDRLKKNEDILLFCFTILKYLIDDEFSVNPRSSAKKMAGYPCEFEAKSPEKKTEGVPLFDETAFMYGCKEEFPLFPDFIPFAEESNDSMDFIPDDPPSLHFVSIDMPPLEEERTSSISMDVCGASSLESGSSNGTPPVEIPGRGNLFGVDYSSGGWQVVSATGSVRDCQSDVETLSSHGSGGIADDNSRKGRLTNIRRLFYRCYYQTLTEKHVNYNDNATVLKSILRNLNDIAQGLKEKQ